LLEGFSSAAKKTSFAGLALRQQLLPSDFTHGFWAAERWAVIWRETTLGTIAGDNSVVRSSRQMTDD
jgi:hypothetical protein